MSERERWVVYPLLFLTLGVSLRDKVLQPVAEEVRCRRLVVYDQQDRKVAELSPVEVPLGGSSESAYAGTLRLLDPFGLSILSVDYEGLNVTGSVNIIGPVNKPVVRLGSSESGGLVQVFHRQGHQNLALGQWEKFSGLLVQSLGSQLQRVLVDAADGQSPLPSVANPSEVKLEGLPPEPDDEPPSSET